MNGGRRSNLERALTRLLPLALGSALEPEEAARLFDRLSNEDWHELTWLLQLHRVEPMVWYGLTESGLTESVNASFAAALKLATRQAFLTNSMRMKSLDRVLVALRCSGIEPIVMKGAALANTVYPDLSTRPMRDVDILLPDVDRESARRVLNQAGFELRNDDTNPDHADALYYADMHGLEFDVHHRFRLYENQDLSSLTEQQVPKHLAAKAITVFEPNALIAHLAVHMQGHRREDGYVLGWLLEFALVTQTYGNRIDPEKVKALVPEDSGYYQVLRIWRFSEEYLNLTLPISIRESARLIQPLSLAEVLRSRRNALWGLPGPAGWLRLAASFVRAPNQPRPRPYVEDLVSWPADILAEIKAVQTGRTQQEA